MIIFIYFKFLRSELEEEAREADRERDYDVPIVKSSNKRRYEESPHKSSHKKKKR